MSNTEIETGVLAKLSFLSRDPRYNVEKPYLLSYESHNVPQHNFVREAVDDVRIHDIRGQEHQLTFERNGIAVLEMETQMQFDDFSDSLKITQCYCGEIAQALYQYMRPKSVQIFDFNVRPMPFSRMHPTDICLDSPSAPGVSELHRQCAAA